MLGLSSYGFEELADELCLAADTLSLAVDVDVATFHGSDRFEPAQGCFG